MNPQNGRAAAPSTTPTADELAEELRPVPYLRAKAAALLLFTLALIVAAALFRGSDTPFSLILFQTNWAVFSILTMAVMEKANLPSKPACICF